MDFEVAPGASRASALVVMDFAHRMETACLEKAPRLPRVRLLTIAAVRWLLETVGSSAAPAARPPAQTASAVVDATTALRERASRVGGARAPKPSRWF